MTAFTVQGHPVTAEQRDAGLAAMRGRFTHHEVVIAMRKAGVPAQILDGTFNPALHWFAETVTDRLLQSERRAGRIRVVKGRGCWEKIERNEG